MLRVTMDSIGSTPVGPVLNSAAMFAASDGRIVVVHDVSVSVFDRAGTIVAHLGREGSGPGEFRGIASAGPMNPSRFWLWDAQQLRMTFLDLDSLTLSSGQFRPTLQEVNGRIFEGQTVLGVDSAGRTLVWAFRASGPSLPGADTPDSPQQITGWWPASSGHPAIVTVSTTPSDCLDSRRHAIPECRASHMAAAVNGKYAVVAVSADRSSLNDRYKFDLVRGDGDTMATFTLQLVGQALDDSTRATWLAKRSARDSTINWDQVPRLPRVEPLQTLLVGRDGTIWVKGILRGADRAWQVISKSGTPLALLWLPDEIWVSDLSATGALASRDLPNGQVVLYRLRFTPPQ